MSKRTITDKKVHDQVRASLMAVYKNDIGALIDMHLQQNRDTNYLLATKDLNLQECYDLLAMAIENPEKFAANWRGSLIHHKMKGKYTDAS